MLYVTGCFSFFIDKTSNTEKSISVIPNNLEGMMVSPFLITEYPMGITKQETSISDQTDTEPLFTGSPFEHLRFSVKSLAAAFAIFMVRSYKDSPDPKTPPVNSSAYAYYRVILYLSVC